MPKMSELSAVLDALIECGKTLIRTAENLRSLYSADESTQKVENLQEAAEPTVEKTITLEEVSAVLAEKSRAGKTTAVKKLLQKHGADKLSDIDPSEYAALLADAEVV